MLDRPERIAFLVAVLIGPIVWFSLLAILFITPSSSNLFFEKGGLPLLEISLLSVFASTAIAFLVEALVRQFLFSRILKIYKMISNPEKHQKGLLNDAEFIGKVEMEVKTWAQSKTTELVNLQTRDDVRREFIANLSHELKTPVFNIQSYLLTLIDGVDEEKTNRKYLKKANRNVERMIRLLRDMDVLAHLESNQLVLNKETYNLSNQIDDALEQMSERIEQSNIKIIRDYDTTYTFTVFADLERMEQVFLNLISNCIKYSKSENKESFIKFSIQEIDNLISVVIEDNGIGISKEDIQRIFERFYRVDRSRTRANRVGGTGLGLAIAKHILEAHGQIIKVTSSLGNGTAFSIPIAKP
ncbi:MAG: Alkaline phosphatase synthesis sensor protein PhoR [Owenweeksia sp. TMED14]|nr:MAG: Alkaline phosphatase synthesis sensor protein PhoR [Owenweeksia sp. TMED14]